MVRRHRPKHDVEHFGVGDYEPSREDAPSIEFGRDAFFRVIARLKPTILLDLCGLGIPIPDLRALTVEDQPEFLERAEIVAWGRRWNLVDDWALDRAVDTLTAWAHGVNLWDFIPGTRFGWTLLNEDERRFTFVDQGYDPATDHWPHYEECLEREFRRALSAYRETQRRKAQAAGLVRVRAKRAQHLVWLARFQVTEQSYAQIASRERTATGKILQGEQAIYDAVKRTAKWLGLTLRTQSKD